jgi:predicted ATP-dependent serine protease
MDSFIEIQDSIKEFNKIAGNSAEKWLVDLMKSHNMGRNKTGAYTSFLCIQQVNKDGSFVGTNKLKHNTHGMMEIRFTGDDRYMQFIKNRKGEVLKKLYYDLSTPKDVSYSYEDPSASFDEDDEDEDEERDYSELGIRNSRD